MIKKLRRRLTIIFTVMTGLVLTAVLIVTLLFSEKQAIFSSNQEFDMNSNEIIFSLYQHINNFSDLSELKNLAKDKGYIVSVKINDDEISSDDKETDVYTQKLLSAAEKIPKAKNINFGLNEDASENHIISPSHYSTNIIISSYSEYDNEVIPEITESEIFFASPSGFIFSDIIQMLFSPADSFEYNPSFEMDDTEYRIKSISFGNSNFDSDNIDLMIIEDLAKMNYEISLLRISFISLMLFGCLLLLLVNWFLSKLIVKPTENSIKQQTEFIAAASHELRSPLAVLNTSLSAADISESPTEAKMYRSIALSASDRLSRLVDDLLLLAGSDSKKWQINMQDFDIDTMIIEMREQYLPISKSRNHRFEIDIPEETLGSIKGDKHRIHQILHILLDNAFEYSPDNSLVTLSAKKQRDKLYLSVTDQGNGIPDNEKGKIFRRFYRADKSRSSKDHFGLGLSIARELAELHSGNLTVMDAPGGGCIFRLKI